MPVVGREHRDAPVWGAVAALTALSLLVGYLFPAAAPWALVGLAGAAVMLLWALRWDPAVVAWLWVLSYGLLDRPFWVWEIRGFFNMTIPRFAFLAAVAVLSVHLLMRRGTVRFGRALLWAMAALLICCALSATAAGWRAEGSALPTAPYFRFLESMLFPFLMFFLVYCAADRPQQIRTALVMFSVYGWYALYIGYLQYAAIMGYEGARRLIFPGYINQPSWGPNYGIHFDRARGAYAMANPQATLLIVLFFADLYLVRRLRGPYRVAAAIQAMLIPPAIFFTGLRSAYVAFLLGGMVWLWCAGRVRLGRVKLAISGLALLLVVAAFWGNLATQKRSIGGMAQKAPIVGRWILAQRSWEIFTHQPLTGAGFGHYIEAEHRLASDPSLLARLGTGLATPHNLLLVMMAETGVAGLALTVLVFVLLYRQSLQLYRRLPADQEGWLSRGFVVVFWTAMAAYLVDAMLVDPLWDVPSNGLFWSLAGLMAGFNRLLEPSVLQPSLPAATAAQQA
jgi:O-antigen ligase